MANITVAPGGGILANGVITYLPECSDLKYADASLKAAEAFDLTDSAYLVSLLPALVPGVLFGVLSIVGCIFFLLWLCVQCGRRRQLRRVRVPEQQQFITGGQSQQPAPSTPWRQRRGCGAFAAKALLVALALALAGVSGWGLAESIKQTDGTVSDFWVLVDAISAKANNATLDLDTLGFQVAHLSGNVSAFSGKAPELLQAFDAALGLLSPADLAEVAAASSRVPNATAAPQLSPAPAGVADGSTLEAVREALAGAVDALVALPQSIDDVTAAIEQGAAILRDNFNQTLQDIRDRFEAPTLAVEDRWRYIPIAVVFGLSILCALLAALTFWSLRWYKTATLVLVLLWLDIALLMLLGVGALRSANTVATDACLYAEQMTLDLAKLKVAASQRAKVVNIFSYYYGLTAIPDAMVVDELFGVPTYQLHDFVYGPILPLTTRVLALSNTSQVQALLVQAGLQGEACPGCISSLTNLTTLLPNVSATVSRLEQQALASAVAPIYRDAKQYLCCTLSKASHELWAAWTAAGALGLALATLCAARMATHTLNLRRYERQLAAARAAVGGDYDEPHDELINKTSSLEEGTAAYQHNGKAALAAVAEGQPVPITAAAAAKAPQRQHDGSAS